MTGILRLVSAAVVGMLLVEARHATDAGDPVIGLAVTVVAIFIAVCTLVATLMEGAVGDRARRAARVWERRALAAESDAADADAAAAALRRSVARWRMRARYWEARYHEAEADVDEAMFHTPMGSTLLEIQARPDTGERTS